MLASKPTPSLPISCWPAPSVRGSGDDDARHDGEADRSIRFEHPNLERSGAQPHPSCRPPAASRARSSERSSSGSSRERAA